MQSLADQKLGFQFCGWATCYSHEMPQIFVCISSCTFRDVRGNGDDGSSHLWGKGIKFFRWQSPDYVICHVYELHSLLPDDHTAIVHGEGPFWIWDKEMVDLKTLDFRLVDFRLRVFRSEDCETEKSNHHQMSAIWCLQVFSSFSLLV